MVVMGRVSIPFGVKGWIKIQPFSEMDDTLADYGEWHILCQGQWVAYAVREVKLHGKGLIANFVGVDERDAAFVLRGREIAVPRISLPPAPANQYYWSDLIGLDVVNTHAHPLGTVEKLLEAGAHDVLVVQAERERLIPFVGQIVLEVDLAARRIVVDWQADY